MKIYVKFLEKIVKIETNNVDFGNFLKDYFVTLDTPETEVFFSVDIKWDYNNWNKIFDEAKKEKNQVFIGGNAWVSDNRVVMVVKNKCKSLYIWNIDDDRFTASIYIKESLKPKFVSLLYRKGEGERKYQMLLRCFFYPIFFNFYLKRQLIPLHAGAVSSGERAIIFCGLDGVGKTCASLFLLSFPNAKFISDNLILAGQNRIYPCYEQIRIHSENRNLLNDKFVSRISAKGCKDFLMPTENPSSQGVVPSTVIFLEFANQTRLLPISPVESVQRALFLNNVAGELYGYQRMFALANLIPFVSKKETIAPHKILSDLFAETQCYRFQMQRSQGLQESMEFLTKKLGLER